MAQLLVRNIDEEVKTKLQQRARRNGRSTEEEVREILRNAVKGESVRRGSLGTRIAARFAGIGFEEDVLEWRGEVARPAKFKK